MSSKLILGGPGSGKTHRLLNILEEEFARGISPDRLAFVSFTKKAVREAKDRVSSRFNLDPKELVYCRTLHSLTLRCLGLTKRDVMTHTHRQDFGTFVNCRFAAKDDLDPFSGTEGDRGIFLDNYARATCRPLREVWEKMGEELRWHWLKWLSESLRQYKRKNFLVDYTDMLTHYLESGEPLGVDVAIIDEAQDLSPLQWKVTEKAFSRAERIYIAGDDDQAIYKWSGADVQYFLDLRVDETEVLPQSHRLTPEVHEYSQEVINRVRYRYPKNFSPVAGRSGKVVYHRYVRGVPVDDDCSWLLLARNRMFLREFEEVIRERGLLYSVKGANSVKDGDIEAIEDFEALRNGSRVSGKRANVILQKAGSNTKFKKEATVKFKDLELRDRVWHEVLEGIPFNQRVYYVTVQRRGTSLTDEPRIAIDTIHGVKGGEADQVALITDMTSKTWRNFNFDPDDEWRCFYVGATRTRGNLHIVLPNTPKAFRL